MKRAFTYEFEDTSPKSIRLDYAGSEGETLKVGVSPDGGVTITVDPGAALVLARAFAQLATCGYPHGFHLHLREDFDADKPEIATLVLSKPK